MILPALASLIIISVTTGLINAEGADAKPVANIQGLSAAVINDNYTGNKEAGIRGRYLGADDFLTVSYLARYDWNNYQAAATFHTVTSRKFSFRYDLVSLLAIKRFAIQKLYVHQGLGVILKGDFGGDEIQNGWHRMKGLPEVDLPYSRTGLAPQALLGSGRLFKDLFISNTVLDISGDLRLGWDYLPFRFRPAMAWNYLHKWVDFELILGAHFFLGETFEYSEMARHGLMGGGGMKIHLGTRFYFNGGMVFIPAKNLENDALFKNKTRNYSPQIWTGFAWNTGGKSLKEFFY